MINTIFGIKGKMTQTFVGDERVPVTIVKVNPNIVTQIKTSTLKDGYNAVQMGTGVKKAKNISKPLKGHLKGAINENKAPLFLREVRVQNESELKTGDKVKVTEVLSQGDTVMVTGTSKGKGFQGGVKRWGFHGGPKTHGQSDRHRAPGSSGQGTTPGRVYKGKHMAGRMGNDTKTVKNLQVISVDVDTNEVMIKGAIPGVPGSLIIIERLGEMKNPIVMEVQSPVEETNAQEAAQETPVEVNAGTQEVVEQKEETVEVEPEVKEEVKEEINA